MLKNINVSVSPHIRKSVNTTDIMLDVVVALLFPLAAGVYTFGWRALMIIAISVISCVLSEYLFQLFMKQKTTIGDMSAVVTGLILAVNLPSTVPFWLPVIGSLFAIIIVKQLFGGIGQNFMNPALAARCFLLISFASIMTKFPNKISHFFSAVDTVSSATPMAMIKNGQSIDWLKMLTDTHSGCIGEASAIAVLIGAAYLLLRRVITIRIPLVYIASTICFVIFIQWVRGDTDLLTMDYLVAQVCGGGLLVGAFFMANDYVTCPITPKGQIVYALLLGLMTALIRTVSASNEGVSYAIIIGNMLTPLIEKYTVPKPFGGKGRVKNA